MTRRSIRAVMVLLIAASLAGCQQEDTGHHGPSVGSTPAIPAGAGTVDPAQVNAPPPGEVPPAPGSVVAPAGEQSPARVAGQGGAGRTDAGQAGAGQAGAGQAGAGQAGAGQAGAGGTQTAQVNVGGGIPAPDNVAAPPADAQRTPSGLAYQVLTPGAGGEHPTAQAKVKVHYTGWTTDGKMFDSSVARGEPIEFPLQGVIPGWTEGVQLMVKGQKTRFWIPAALAYGETPRRPGAPAGMLVFDIELLDFSEPAPPPPAPDNVAAPPADAQRTPSGLAYQELSPGTGTEHPTAQAKVKVHYTGWTTDGEMFDSSVVRGEPIEFPLQGVIPGWTEGVQRMVKGQKMRFWIPAALAYGETPTRPGAPAGMLVFDIELLDFSEPTPPPPAPANVAAPPADAQRTPSGLAYQELSPGTGTVHPKPTDRVKVHYTGWTTGGEMFDSSVVRGQPATFPLGGVIKGWTEGLQLMVEGQKVRFWIPAALAYGETPTRPGAPSGMLVFDVELLDIL